MEKSGPSPEADRLPLPAREFIALAALLISLTAMSLDIMLPVLPEVAAALGVESANDRQWVVSCFIAGLLVGQLFAGPLADRFGRLPVLLGGLTLFAAASVVATAATDFSVLLAARALQGLAAAAPRIAVVAIIRDLFTGREMARTTSMVMTVFITVPIFAPALGQGLAYVAGWRTPFMFLALVGIVAVLWVWARLPETRARDSAPIGVGRAFARVLSTRRTMAYILASGCMFACLFSYIISAQQIFVDTYGLGAWFPAAFAGIALAMALANFVNVRIVVRLGMQRVSHTALVAFLVSAAAMLALARTMELPLPAVWGWLALQFFLFGLIASNFNALAMEPMGEVAGTASALMGFITTLISGMGGAIVGQLYDGSAVPLVTAFTLLPALAIAAVLAAEGAAGFGRDPGDGATR